MDDVKLKARIAIEKRIAREVVQVLIANGYALNLDNGGEGFELPHPITDAEQFLALMFATDEDRVFAYKGAEPHGWVYFVYGNEGWDVINDNTTNLEPFIGSESPIGKLQDTILGEIEKGVR